MNENFGFRHFFSANIVRLCARFRLFAPECDNELSSNNEVADAHTSFYLGEKYGAKLRTQESSSQ